MIYSYTQISQYLTCPRRYRYRYVDGWKEKDKRAAMLFGRAFELALGAYFRSEDPGEVFFREWLLYKEQNLIFAKDDSWDRMLERAITLLIRFCQDDRIQISKANNNLQAKFSEAIGKNEFVSYVDGIGTLDGKRCLLEWKTSSARYPEERTGLLALDPQLICYSWITGIEEVSQIVFVRKRFVEVQYLRASITEKQRQEFGYLVVKTIRRIESAEFLPHSGIRFPQNPCSSCPYVGLCLGRQAMLEPGLVRRPGAEELDWIDELTY